MKEENKHPKLVCQPGNEVPDCKYQEEMKNARRGYICGTALTGPIPGPKGTATPAVAWKRTGTGHLRHSAPSPPHTRPTPPGDAAGGTYVKPPPRKEDSDTHARAGSTIVKLIKI